MSNLREEQGLARRGDVAAQERLAWRYHTGKGVRKSETKSFRWSARAALSGRSPLSAYNLSIAYFNGEGVAPDVRKAFLWARKSAEADLPEGCFALGVHYLRGYGVKPNLRAALDALNRAWELGRTPAAAELLSDLYFYGEELRKSYRQAFKWTVRAALSGGSAAMAYRLNLLYLDGLGVERDVRRAFWWGKRSARRGWPDGMLATGWHYLNGLGAATDLQAAQRWFRCTLEAAPDCAQAYYNLGLIYHEVRDDEAAYRCYSRAYAINRHPASAYRLARMLATGRSAAADTAAAERLLRSAAKQGCHPAQRLLAARSWRRIVTRQQEIRN